MRLVSTTKNVPISGSSYHSVPTSPSIPIYALLLRVYYRLITDEEGQADFAKAIPPFGGLGDNYWDIVFKNHLLSMEAMADWCTLLGVKNRGIVDLMLDKMEEKHPVFHDETIGFFMRASKKLEEMAKMLMNEEEAKPRESEYIAFVDDIMWNFTLLLQCVPRLVYRMVDSVQSLLFHSDLKHILIGIFAACKKHPDTQQCTFRGRCSSIVIAQCYDLMCEKMIFCYADPSLQPTTPSLHDGENCLEFRHHQIRSNLPSLAIFVPCWTTRTRSTRIISITSSSIDWSVFPAGTRRSAPTSWKSSPLARGVTLMRSRRTPISIRRSRS